MRSKGFIRVKIHQVIWGFRRKISSESPRAFLRTAYNVDKNDDEDDDGEGKIKR